MRHGRFVNKIIHHDRSRTRRSRNHMVVRFTTKNIIYRSTRISASELCVQFIYCSKYVEFCFDTCVKLRLGTCLGLRLCTVRVMVVNKANYPGLASEVVNRIYYPGLESEIVNSIDYSLPVSIGIINSPNCPEHVSSVVNTTNNPCVVLGVLNPTNSQ